VPRGGALEKRKVEVKKAEKKAKEVAKETEE
jgi:hypothetical protein